MPVFLPGESHEQRAWWAIDHEVTELATHQETWVDGVLLGKESSSPFHESLLKSAAAVFLCGTACGYGLRTVATTEIISE